MKNSIKKIICILLTLAFAMSVPFSCFAAQNAPYVSNGLYYRFSDNEYISFNTDYDEMIKYFQSRLISHSNKIEQYRFATTDTEYKYNTQIDGARRQQISSSMIFSTIYSPMNHKTVLSAAIIFTKSLI